MSKNKKDNKKSKKGKKVAKVKSVKVFIMPELKELKKILKITIKYLGLGRWIDHKSWSYDTLANTLILDGTFYFNFTRSEDPKGKGEYEVVALDPSASCEHTIAKSDSKYTLVIKFIQELIDDRIDSLFESLVFEDERREEQAQEVREELQRISKSSQPE